MHRCGGAFEVLRPEVSCGDKTFISPDPFDFLPAIEYHELQVGCARECVEDRSARAVRMDLVGTGIVERFEKTGDANRVRSAECSGYPGFGSGVKVRAPILATGR